MESKRSRRPPLSVCVLCSTRPAALLQDTHRDKQMADMAIQMEKLNKAHSDLRREQTENLANVLESICE